MGTTVSRRTQWRGLHNRIPIVQWVGCPSDGASRKNGVDGWDGVWVRGERTSVTFAGGKTGGRAVLTVSEWVLGGGMSDCDVVADSGAAIRGTRLLAVKVDPISPNKNSGMCLTGFWPTSWD
ncbi:hypothetical protein GCM10009765_42040 [Fodinicola feengrottensis]|uniref:Uncharacterized protein n=1 Tax=Fodinicola feengrottensis TaxID=435914 RepID=A0ABN2HHR1_9ACTN